MRVLVTGAGGMLGQDMVRAFSGELYEVVGMGREEFDISNPVHQAELVSGTFGKFDLIINCAAYTKVDQAETERDEAFLVNAIGASMIAQSAAVLGAKLIHFSTDYVFDGTSLEPYKPDDRPKPINAYGESKLEGEYLIREQHPGAVIIRTSWLYGPYGRCFPKSATIRAMQGKPLFVVKDQVGKPTYTGDLAARTVKLLENLAGGCIIHAAGPEKLSWFDFTERILAAADIENSGLTPILTSDYITAAKRPMMSSLDTSEFDAIAGPPQELDDSLKDFFSKCREELLALAAAET